MGFEAINSTNQEFDQVNTLVTKSLVLYEDCVETLASLIINFQNTLIYEN